MKSIFIILTLLNFSMANDLINTTGIKEDKSERLQGIDKNENRIRDDIEADLKKTYSNKRELTAMINLAKIDDVLFQANEMMDIEAIDKFLIERKKAILCIKLLLNSPNRSSFRNGDFSINRYENKLQNTEERKIAFERIKEHYSEDIIYDNPTEDCGDKEININY